MTVSVAGRSQRVASARAHELPTEAMRCASSLTWGGLISPGLSTVSGPGAGPQLAAVPPAATLCLRFAKKTRTCAGVS